MAEGQVLRGAVIDAVGPGDGAVACAGRGIGDGGDEFAAQFIVVVGFDFDDVRVG